MTKFADQLYTDLIREHGSTLADTRPLAGSGRQFASRRVLLAAGAGGVAVAATAGVLTAGVLTPGGGTPAYALTTNPDGTVTLAVYQESGIAQANAKLHLLGDRVVVVPVRPGCPSVHSLPPPAVRPSHKSSIAMTSRSSRDGHTTVSVSGIPAGDILVVGVEVSAHSSAAEAALTTPPAPSCVSPPPAPRSGK
jgi:hypothetical protein